MLGSQQARQIDQLCQALQTLFENLHGRLSKAPVTKPVMDRSHYDLRNYS